MVVCPRAWAPDILAGRNDRARIAFRLSPGVALPAELGERAKVDGTRVEIASDDTTRDLHELTGWALRSRVDLHSLTVARATLEEVFLDVIEAVMDVVDLYKR